MKFGSVENPENIDFNLPVDHAQNFSIPQQNDSIKELYVGSAKWNRQYLKGFYPKGTKDELAYYATQYNCIELNTTFYNNYQPEQIIKWRDRVPIDFRFFPKVHQYISHIKRLKDSSRAIEEFCHSAWAFEEKLGMAFLQMPENFTPKSFQSLVEFIEDWPIGLPLAFELRNEEWFKDHHISNELFDLFKANQITTVLTDTPGRRDLLHMALTTDKAFIRFVSSYHQHDFQRMDDWAIRLKEWKRKGLSSIYFFIHQDMEKNYTFLSTSLTKKFNEVLGSKLTVPHLANFKTPPQQTELF